MVLACVHETVWHIHANDRRPVSFDGPNHLACFYIPKPNNCIERIFLNRFNDDYVIGKCLADGKCHYMNLPPQKKGSCLWDLLPRLSLSKSVPSKSVKTNTSFLDSKTIPTNQAFFWTSEKKNSREKTQALEKTQANFPKNSRNLSKTLKSANSLLT